jgi:hypothetical protein
VFEAAAEANCQVRSIMPAKTSLEDVYAASVRPEA